ncbi:MULTISPECIES: ribosome recycling factor [Hydrocarboniphaga]|jgi:ribosome recycling factor|uniref:Ribosome-recycling factor n=1 Tax=Hydrocarboniphaga effusa AP103 TaxID=1172194 RepID=I8T2P5_9GAMM|nr:MULTISPECIES: ribosome recycling factor [Hydrocarboniphaga]EIT68195.1 ribosome recycling factor [Hydrocarboniphaga effusa AP103]MDZ4078290.1 ribosome recycling factor [Hydrocarboniphaga sp.]
MLNDIKKDATERMNKSVDSLRHELAKLRTGRANAALLDHIRVDYYGSEVPLSQTAQITVEDARTISITAWEKNMVSVIEKAIMKSDLGLNPNTAGTIIRIIMPPLTEERRRDLVKVVKSEAEGARVAIRSVRRDANQDIKELAKEKLISADDEKRGETDIQKLTDQFVAKIDEVAAAKEKELMSM